VRIVIHGLVIVTSDNEDILLSATLTSVTIGWEYLEAEIGDNVIVGMEQERETFKDDLSLKFD